MRYRDIYGPEKHVAEFVLAWSVDYERAIFHINAKVTSAVKWVWFHCEGQILKYERTNDQFCLIESSESLEMPLENKKAFKDIPSVFGRDSKSTPEN